MGMKIDARQLKGLRACAPGMLRFINVVPDPTQRVEINWLISIKAGEPSDYTWLVHRLYSVEVLETLICDTILLIAEYLKPFCTEQQYELIMKYLCEANAREDQDVHNRLGHLAGDLVDTILDTFDEYNGIGSTATEAELFDVQMAEYAILSIRALVHFMSSKSWRKEDLKEHDALYYRAAEVMLTVSRVPDNEDRIEALFTEVFSKE